jgi:serine palmitoyltransferase
MNIGIKKILDINPLFEIVLWYRENVSPLTKDEIIDLIIHAPSYYLIWWKSIFNAAPLHIFIETALVLFIFWLIFIRRTVDPKRASKNEKLTEKEINWLVDEWKPEPLVPDLNETDILLADNMTVSN